MSPCLPRPPFDGFGRSGRRPRRGSGQGQRGVPSGGARDVDQHCIRKVRCQPRVTKNQVHECVVFREYLRPAHYNTTLLNMSVVLVVSVVLRIENPRQWKQESGELPCQVIFLRFDEVSRDVFRSCGAGVGIQEGNRVQACEVSESERRIVAVQVEIDSRAQKGQALKSGGFNTGATGFTRRGHGGSLVPPHTRWRVYLPQCGSTSKAMPCYSSRSAQGTRNAPALRRAQTARTPSCASIQGLPLLHFLVRREKIL